MGLNFGSLLAIINKKMTSLSDGNAVRSFLFLINLDSNKKYLKLFKLKVFFYSHYDPYGNRTRDTAVKGRCLNRLTNGPFYLKHKNYYIKNLATCKVIFLKFLLLFSTRISLYCDPHLFSLKFQSSCFLILISYNYSYSSYSLISF